MYIPEIYRIDDPATIATFMRSYSFATIVTHDGSAPYATNMPVIFHPEIGPRGTLFTHIARANPQWTHFEDGREILIIFSGPHAYVSPSSYVTFPAVPTWHYTAVHAYGIPTIVNDPDRVLSMLDELIEFYEGSRKPRWENKTPDPYRERLLSGIVAFEIPISRLEAKFKIGQNRLADQPGVLATLSASADPADRALAAFVNQHSPTLSGLDNLPVPLSE